MNPTPLRAPRPRRGQLLAAAAVSTALFLGACSGQGTAEGPSTAPASDTATSPAPAPGTTAAATPSAGSTGAASADPGSTDPGSTAEPSAQTAVKELVAGFPSTVLPLFKGAQIQSSSLEKSSPLSMASLTATTTAKPADILEFYTKSLTGQDFKAQPGDAVDGVPMKTYVRAAGQEIVTVSVVVTSETSTFTVGATLLPASLK